MRKLIISESERKNILRQHGSLILEQSASEKLRLIQIALGAEGDKVIGPDTTKKIVSTLQSAPKTSGDFGCVANLKNDEVVTIINQKGEKTENKVEVIDMTMKGADGKTTGGMEYQIGEILFKPNGTYFDLNQPNTPLKYTCSGTTIQTSNHGNIEKGSQKVDNTETIKTQISNLRNQERDDDFIVKSLLTKYTKEEILKADPNLKSILDKTESKPGETQKPAVDMSKREESGETFDETTIKNLGIGRQQVTDKLGTRPAGF
jgi:hypothetical protein